ncbi:hypothetical protein PRUPE_3G282700 [Prunus persica]|uniref:Glycosyltransferase n=1 Tax=Prunus persica TaxID=3760 RepID=M5WTG7_PRUPE|nr:UDP-glycosyltransferase 90A1 [Prunus persica]ONI19517.1 hypothetical protein PRUPE_3G282700 [Prunus persica]
MGSTIDSQHVEDEGHVVLFPFMSKGHTIPLLHLSRLFLSRRLRVTIFTTPANRPFINQSLADTSASVISLPFPQSISPEIPSGVESTDNLPSINLFFPFALTTGHMQPDFERALQTLPRVSFMVSDAFLWWTLDSADKLGFPRFVFYGFGNYAMDVSKVVAENRLLHGPESDDELITVTRFPWIKITRKDFFHEAFTKDDHDQPSQASEFHMKAAVATNRSFGMIVNSFYELEPVFTDYWNSECEPKAWCVGPLCQVAQDEPHDDHQDKPIWIEWLDEKLEKGSWVLYVAFGTQAELSAEQLQEISKGLENSNINFLWVIRSKGSEETAAWDINGFEERVKGRGMVVKEWVDQRRILMHESVKGFVSHCGWNSVLEGICAGVPILAWPMMAEQPLNARMVVEEIKVGLRVETCDGSVKGFVKSEGLEKMVKELMEGEKGEEVRKKVKEFADLASKAVKEGGSSWLTLQSLTDEMRQH